MYIVRDKKTKAIIHINPAPSSQALDGEEIYYKYNSKTMEIGRTDLPDLPEHFKIDAQQNIIELSLEEQVSAGILQLAPEQKIVDNQVVEKTVSEKIRDGLFKLAPTQKIVGSGAEEQIVDKTPSELLAGNLIKLNWDQKIIGSGEEERIVTKSPKELVKEGLWKLSPNQKIEGNEVVTYTDAEMCTKGYITLDQYKNRKLGEFSALSFQLMEVIVPHYKLLNAGMGIYDEAEYESIKATIQAFRDEYHNLEQQVEAAPDLQAVQTIKENYPREKVTPGS